MADSSESLDRDLVLSVLLGEGAEDLIFLLREELRFLRTFRRQDRKVQEAFLAHRRSRSEAYSLSPQELEDRKDPIYRATGVRA